MANKKFEEQLAALDSFRNTLGSATAVEGLRKALANRNNYLVAKAAKIASAEALQVLIPELVVAFDRFFVDPAKTDPQCWAKNAIAKALAEMGYDEPEPYLRGLRHVQLEPSWGGSADSAATLRAQCAVALVQCRSIPDLVLLSHLLELLFDPVKTVRVEAARAIGRVSRTEAALILRVRALAGDQEPEVLGACFSALLSIEGGDGIRFVSRFLDNGGDVAGEAALALGMLREFEALEVLKERWPRERDPALASVLLTAIALMRLPEATDYLLKLCESDSTATVTAALKALASAPVPSEVLARIEDVVKRKDDPRISATFDKYFRVSS